MGWMDDLQFYVLFNSISVISGPCTNDNERLCAMEPRLQFRRFHLERGSNSGPTDQETRDSPTELPGLLTKLVVTDEILQIF